MTLAGVAHRKNSERKQLADGRYVITGKPRAGGLASVYRALDTADEQFVALKVFRAVSGPDEIIEESFRRETQALSDLKHPHVVKIFDAGFDEVSGEHYIAMEWVDHDLEAIKATKPFSSWTDFYTRIGQQVLEAIAFAHTHATVHRDIKPSNILVTAAEGQEKGRCAHAAKRTARLSNLKRRN